MANEFLSRIAGLQNQSLFGKSILAKGEELVNQKISQTTDVVNNAANEMALLSGSADMKSIDEKIEELSIRPDVSESSFDIKKTVAQMNDLSIQVAKKQKGYNNVYNKAIMSLGTLGGDDATRALNMIAREQGLTNKELDDKLDAVDLVLKRQSAYTSAVINSKQLSKIEEDESLSKLTNLGKDYLLNDPEYQSLTDMYFESSSKLQLERFERSKSNIIDKAYEKLKDKGVTRDMLEKSFAKANLYTGKFQQNRGPGNIDTKKEDELKAKYSINLMEQATELVRTSGGWDKVKAALDDPKNNTLIGLDGNVIEPGSHTFNLLINTFGNHIDSDGLPIGSAYDRYLQNVLAVYPDFNNTKNMQSELRIEALNEGLVIPPQFDIETIIPTNPLAVNSLLFDGSSGLKNNTYNPEVTRDIQSVYEQAKVKGTFMSSPVGAVKNIEQTPMMAIGGLGGSFNRGFKYKDILPEDLPNYLKISNAIQSIMKGGITDDEIPGLQNYLEQAKEEYIKRDNERENAKLTNTKK